MKLHQKKLENSYSHSALDKISDEIKEDTLTGTVERILFKNEETGFSIFVINVGNKQAVIVRGTIASIQAGEHICALGSWVMHPKFGKQFQATNCTITQPTGIVGLKKYLGSGLIKGIGPVYAERLVDYFGQKVLDIIDKYPDRLKEVPGIGQKRIDTIAAAWKDHKQISHIMVFLQDKGISTVYATKIYKTYRAQSIEIMLENPYKLSEDIWGIGFKTADQIAQKMNIAPDSLQRFRAGIIHVITTHIQDGHLYCELEALKEKTYNLLEQNHTNNNSLKIALHNLYDDQKIKVISHKNQHFVTLSQYYFSEKGVALLFKQLEKNQSDLCDIHKSYEHLRTLNATQKIELNEDQQKGIIAALQNKVTIITGGPGTGKTTLIKQLLTILDENKIIYKLAAPTGRAAKRITQGTGRLAVTLHRLLEFDPSIMNFKKNEQNALELDVLIVDEASMIDIFLAYAVLKSIPHTAHIVFIGDIDQLPSVGAGNFLKDSIECKQFTTIHLTHIFRQAQDSLIVTNAHRINNAEFPLCKLEQGKKDFFFIPEEDPLTLPDHFKKIYNSLLPKAHIPSDQSMVLSPMNRGTAGTQKLNHDLQQLINPIKSEDKKISFGPYTYTIGDQVMQIKNNYEKLIFNGDIGKIEAIDTQEKNLHINFSDRSVVYEFSDLDELVLAYAISIHKSQGSEYDAVIIPIFMQHFTLLQRNVLYTAITRAKKLCILIGQAKAIWIAIKNNKDTHRITFLKEFLTTDLTCR